MLNSPRPILLSSAREREESVLSRSVSSRCGPNIHFQRGAYAVTRSGKRWMRRRKDIDVSAPWCRCEKVVCICIEPVAGGGSISVFALREPRSSKWCFVPHYLNRSLYRGRPSDEDAGVKERQGEKERKKLEKRLARRCYNDSPVPFALDASPPDTLSLFLRRETVLFFLRRMELSI